VHSYRLKNVLGLGQEEDIESIPQFENIVRNQEFKEEKFGLAITG
jgi:hypothetical protein